MLGRKCIREICCTNLRSTGASFITATPSCPRYRNSCTSFFRSSRDLNKREIPRAYVTTNIFWRKEWCLIVDYSLEYNLSRCICLTNTEFVDLIVNVMKTLSLIIIIFYFTNACENEGFDANYKLVSSKYVHDIQSLPTMSWSRGCRVCRYPAIETSRARSIRSPSWNMYDPCERVAGKPSDACVLHASRTRVRGCMCGRHMRQQPIMRASRAISENSFRSSAEFIPRRDRITVLRL